MNIIVCVKQVPDTLAVGVDSKTNTLIREGVDSVINPFDLHAAEVALRLKERYGGVVTALSMGPSQVIDTLRQVLSLGVERAVLLCDIGFAGADTLATSYTLATAVKKLGRFDLIICGRQAVDGDTAHVGPSLAEKLGIPHISCAVKIHKVTDKYIIAQRMTDGAIEKVKLSLPGLITVSKSINKPRTATLKGKMKAARAEVEIWSAHDIGADESKIGLKGSATRVVKMATPKHDRAGLLLEGSVAEQVKGLALKLQQAKVL
ncbi:MAG TPA: electron transfer flavoprotein subunit beta/FixA family protein [Planctomycetes bacterium]|nr:electron transfer flavoprotein subunit beta/FixA family protein [Planctomycetota bacterium]HIJ70338.1 electron transfer flavoprotein subunit beta/FixA family protein [Planctomycetota bacterium]